jgi:hypothetical protein
MNKFRPRITREEFEVVQQYRAIKRECDDQDIDLKTVKHGWLKSKNTSACFSRILTSKLTKQQNLKT